MKKIICIYCVLLINVFAVGANIDDPVFKYRCAEYAYNVGNYEVAHDFYEDILARHHEVSHLSMFAILGVIDSNLSIGDWVSADKFISQYDISCFQSLIEYDSLLLRECFLLIKNNHIKLARHLLFSVNFLQLSVRDLAWYHCLYAVILSHYRNFHDAESEFDIACGIAVDRAQLASIEAIRIQSIIHNIDIDSDVESILSLLRNKIEMYEYTQLALPFFKQYVLLLNHLKKHDDELIDSYVSNFLFNLPFNEDIFQLLIYQAIYLGLTSTHGLDNLKTTLLLSNNPCTQLLVLKLLTHVSLSKETFESVMKILDDGFNNSHVEWLKRQILLAKMAIALNENEVAFCQNAASQYIDTFTSDKIFDEIYELLACLSINKDSNEYRLSAHYLDKVRSSIEDTNVKLAITLKIADAFFCNHDFKLAAEIYTEILMHDHSKKFQDVIENQIICDIFLQNFDQAEYHLSLVDCFSEKKCDAILQYIKVLKEKKFYARALNYIDSLRKKGMQRSFKLKLMLCKSQILFAMKQYNQVILLCSKISELFYDKQVNVDEEMRDLISCVHFLKGCSALKLRDIESAKQSFDCLRTYFNNNKYITLSLIKEAKFYMKSGNLYKARTLLEQCETENEWYNFYAKYQMGKLLCLEGNMREALNMFESIIQHNEVPDLAVLARIFQGDILRILGNFSDAITIYERVLSKTDEEKYIKYASLARAKCLIARSSRDAKSLDNALVELKKLYLMDSNDLVWNLEVVAEYCLALKLKNNFGELQSVALNKVKNLPENEIFAIKNARFWTLQILFLLQGSLTKSDVDKCDENFVADMIKKYQCFSDND